MWNKADSWIRMQPMSQELSTSDTSPILGLKARVFAIYGVLSRREIIGICVIACLVFLVLLLSGLLGSCKTRRNTTRTKNSDVSDASHPLSKKVCYSEQCLFTASYILKSMDKTIDRCENFYDYACGNWEKNFPPKPFSHINSVGAKLREKSYSELFLLMLGGNKQYTHDSAERKLKRTFETCVNDIGKLSYSTQNLLSLLKPLAYWQAINVSWNPRTWNLSLALSSAHGVIRTKALYGMEIIKDLRQSKRYILKLNIGGTGFDRWHFGWYKEENAYQNFLRKVGNLVAVDLNSTMDKETLKGNLDTFVADVMKVEEFIHTQTQGTNKAYKIKDLSNITDEVLTLKELSNLVGNVLDFKTILRLTFNGKVHFDDLTPVRIDSRKQFLALGQFLQNLQKNNTLKRVLNNYLTWQSLYKYLKHLSYRFEHALRSFLLDIGDYYIPSISYNCFTELRSLMPEVVSHIWITTHHQKENRDLVERMIKYIKTATTTRLRQTFKMDRITRQKLLNEFSAIEFNVGYPEWITDVEQINVYYNSYDHSAIHIRNMLALNAIQTKQEARLLTNGLAKHAWYRLSVISDVTYNKENNGITIPLAMLQFPYIEHDQPNYVNFGGLTEHIAVTIIDVLFNTVQGWRYEVLKSFHFATACLEKQFNKLLSEYRDHKVLISKKPALQPLNVFKKQNAVLATLQAYREWVKNGTQDEKLPGLEAFTGEQLLFITYVQTYCESLSENEKIFRTEVYRPPTKWLYNLALANVPDFAKSFNCQPGSFMHPAQTCNI